MSIYIFLLILLFFFLAIRVRNTFLILVFLIFIATFRDYSVGVDTYSYWLSYNYEIDKFHFSLLLKKIEPGWLFLNTWVQEIFGDFKMVLFLASVLTIIPISYVFRKATPNPILAFLFYVLIFYYFFSFSIVRQAIAVSFFVLSVFFFERDKYIKAFISISIGALFHYSAIALIPIVFLLKKIKVSYSTSAVVVIITFFIGFSGLVEIAKSYMVYLPFEKYANYESYGEGREFNRVASYLFILPKSVLFLYMGYYDKKLSLQLSSLQMKIFWTSTIVLNLFLTIPQVSRFSMYMSIFEILLMVNMIYNVPAKKRIEMVIVVFTYAMIYFVYYCWSNRFGVVPYIFDL